MRSLVKEIGKEITSSIGISLISDVYSFIKTIDVAVITVNNWSTSYDKINKIVHSLDPEKYDKHKRPTTNRQFYELELGTSYFIRRKDITIKVEAFREAKTDGLISPQNRIRLTFYGKNKFRWRAKFVQSCMKISDKQHTSVHYLVDDEMTNMIITHSFDHIVLSNDSKARIINGLLGWYKSKEWYKEHQMIHKIGVFLYGKPGTGKTSVTRAISNMFHNAPILTLEISNIMKSIKEILEMRKRYDRTLIVLIEDFDMYFKSREEIEGEFENIEIKKQKDFNQNAIFQLLDGMYSTEDTIYIATTNYKDRIDPALIRYGRFDIQEELKYFEQDEALKAVELLGYDKKVLDSFNLEYPVQPSELQSKVFEYRSSSYKKGE